MTALTFNNLGCYYKKVKKPKVAYRYMLKALELEEQCDLPESHLASTKLNICAILSSMSKHTEAVQYANSACSDLIEALKLIKIKCLPDDKMNRAIEHFSINLKKLAHADPGNRPLLHQTLSIAYYNLAVEFEYIQNFEEAMKTYSKAKYFANLTGNFSFVT
jgi:tetratricopeptide (TPR) repeat protein